MSQMAIIEIADSVIDLTKINNKCVANNIYFDTNFLFKLVFFEEGKKYINVINDLESKELDMLIFDYNINLRDYKKIYDVISPLFNAVIYLIDNNIEANQIKLFISEDCNVENEDFIKINIDYLNFKESFIDYISSHNIITTNCFPPIVFTFI